MAASTIRKSRLRLPRHMTAHAMPRVLGELLRYAVVGVLNTAIGLGTILVLQAATALGPYWCNACGYAAGLLVSFLINRAWTFGTRDRAIERAVRFLLAFAVAYAANLAMLFASVTYLHLGVVVAQVAANIVYSLLFFALCKLVVFRASSLHGLTATATQGVRPR